MKTTQVSEVSSPALDWLVAVAEGFKPTHCSGVVFVGGDYHEDGYAPSTDWSQGGPLLNQHKISRTIDRSGLWIAYAGYNLNDEQRHMQCDRSELVAGLRCLVALNLGEVVDVPEELL